MTYYYLTVERKGVAKAYLKVSYNYNVEVTDLLLDNSFILSASSSEEWKLRVDNFVQGIGYVVLLIETKDSLERFKQSIKDVREYERVL